MNSEIRPLNEALQLIAEKELNEVPERIPEDLQKFKEWILSQPHLKVRMDDQFLIMFLRGTKYSLEKAKKKLDSFYTIRTMSPEWFGNKDPLEPNIYTLIKRGPFLPLPNLESPGSFRVLLGKCEKLENASSDEVVKLFHIFWEIMMLEDDNCTVAGVGLVVDMKNFPIKLIPQLTPSLLRSFFEMIQIGSPARLKKLIYINVPPVAEILINITKLVLNEKIKSRFTVYGSNYEALFDYIPKHLFPTEYGGEAGPIRKIAELWEKKITIEYREYLMDDASFGVDEAKRPKERLIGIESEFGIDGSFRKLNID